MIELADSFERAVGGIVGVVSSSSTELQATAQQMTATAQETRTNQLLWQQPRRGLVQRQHRRGSGRGVGLVGSEIGRQVQGSATLAQAAVGEAAQTAQLVQALKATSARSAKWSASSPDRGADQPPGPQRDHRGGARRRGGQGLRGGGDRSEGPGRADGSRDAQEIASQIARDPGRDGSGRLGHRHHRSPHPRDRHRRHQHRGGRRAAGRRDPGDRAQRLAGRDRYLGSDRTIAGVAQASKETGAAPAKCSRRPPNCRGNRNISARKLSASSRRFAPPNLA